ncbi:hypothetical protein THRCLA_23410 [Thraustotheca clavata]|uniref:BED-type domain-containing protein n=1 Tax=Thraustotheca clavata TaxID=74557 RepID=A0A1V9Y691_9STRA|nr:hypothetical protein THRCLA_23410 [Thraustotheca clavata]
MTDKRPSEDEFVPVDTEPGSQARVERKRKRLANASFIWEHFRKSEDKKTIICLHCQPEGSTRFAYSGGTSTMNRHLRRKHGIFAPGKCAEDYENNENFIRLPLQMTSDGEIKADDSARLALRTTKQSMNQTQQWIHYAVAQYLPLDIDTDLQQLLKSKTTGAFQALQGPALIATLREATSSIRAQLHGYLVAVRPKLSLSIDVWDISASFRAYVATAHWVTDTFERRQCPLDISLLSNDKPFVLWFQALLEAFGIEDQIVAVTLGRDCPISSLQTAFPGLIFVPCMLHQLEDIVRSLFASSESVLHRCRELIIRYPRQGISLDSPQSSWWSTCEMISQLVANENIWKNELSHEDWCILVQMTEVLIPIQALLQNCLSESSILTPLASLVFAMLHGISKRLLSFQGALQKSFANSLQSLLKLAPSIFHISCALDPRFKTLPFLSSNEKHAALVTLSASMEKPNNDTLDNGVDATPKKKDSLMMAWSEMYPFEDNSTIPLQTTVQSYLDAATSLTAASPNDLVDPSAWWKVNIHVFGEMSTLAKSYLSVSPFCLSVQEVLQPALRYRKTQLSTQILDMVVFLRSALHIPELQDTRTQPMLV